MSEHELRMQHYENQREHKELAYEIRRKEQELRSKIECIHEESVTYEELEDLRSELLERQNHMFRAFARELRNLRNHWHFQDADYGVTGRPQE
jgi:hypothetical protein